MFNLLAASGTWTETTFSCVLTVCITVTLITCIILFFKWCMCYIKYKKQTELENNRRNSISNIIHNNPFDKNVNQNINIYLNGKYGIHSKKTDDINPEDTISDDNNSQNNNEE